MKIIFVGIHNKPGKIPLCSSTPTGKIIKQITEKIKTKKIVKTNLYDVDYLPVQEIEKGELANEWLDRVNIDTNDVIVLLGKEVQEYFPLKNGNIINIPHPSSLHGKEAIAQYIKNSVKKINEA